ncbi:MAG: LysR family transcriptional regulator [Gemmobacter sp.]|jgi:DNA-binding transcriptional LysR family regulator|nr:LysR family transcriptional regulator [Gemmobacter sp.]
MKRQVASTVAADEEPGRQAGRGLDQTGAEVSIRRLQAFWAVAHTGSMTRAAKLLGVTQPSLSQQLAAFETGIGGRLFDRRTGGLELTELGASMISRAEQVLRSVQELEDVLPATGARPRHALRIAGAGSVMRKLLPEAILRLNLPLDGLELDLHEGAPGEVLEALYARRATIGLVAAGSLPDAALGFRQVQVACDPYVLAVPDSLDLDGVADPADLPPAAAATLNATLQFVFGTHHSRRIQDWYDRALPDNRLRARVRTFEPMTEMVRAGLGVCIAPALVFADSAAGIRGLRLYHTGLEPRRIVALFPSQYQSVAPYGAMIEALIAAGGALALPLVQPMPDFVARAMADRDGPGRPAGQAVVRGGRSRL